MSLIELTNHERLQLLDVLHESEDAHLYRRALAILLIDEGDDVAQVAGMLDVHRSNVYRWMDAFAA